MQFFQWANLRRALILFWGNKLEHCGISNPNFTPQNYSPISDWEKILVSKTEEEEGDD